MTGEADNAVGGEVGAVRGDRFQQDGAAGAGSADEADGAAAGQQPDQPLALLLALQQSGVGQRGARRHGRPGGARGLGAAGCGVLQRPFRVLPRRPVLDLAAVHRVDGEQELARDEPDGADGCGSVLAEIAGEGVPGRAPAGAAGLTLGTVTAAVTAVTAVTVVAVLLGSRVVRVHWS